MIQLSYSSLSILHDRPHCWLNKMMGIPQPEKPEWAVGKRIHRIVQDHVAGIKPDERFSHIDYKFPVVEEVDFDERCKFELDMAEMIDKYGKFISGGMVNVVNPRYKIIGFRDGSNFDERRFLEIKSSDPVWSLSRFKKSFQRKIYTLTGEFDECLLITLPKDESRWSENTIKTYLLKATEQDKVDAMKYILDGIKILESGNFTTDLVDGKCIDRWCYWGANCQFK